MCTCKTRHFNGITCTVTCSYLSGDFSLTVLIKCVLNKKSVNKFFQELDLNSQFYYIISMKDENNVEKSSNYL